MREITKFRIIVMIVSFLLGFTISFPIFKYNKNRKENNHIELMGYDCDKVEKWCAENNYSLVQFAGTPEIRKQFEQ